MDESSATGSDALEDVAFLSRSENRLGVLQALTEGSRPRRELQAVTGTSRTTLGRILRELQDRRWAERTADGEYVATPRGKLVASEFTPLVEAIGTIRTLGEAATWIPTDELSIGLRHFADATVRRSEPNAPFELVEYLADLVRDGDAFLGLTFLEPPRSIGEAMHASVVEGDGRAEGVLAGGLVEHLRDRPKSTLDWREFLLAGGRFYRYDGHVPCNLFVVDETALVMSDRPKGRAAAVETANETARTELVALYERYRDDAEPVAPEYFD